MAKLTEIERFWAKVRPEAEGCWMWTAAKNWSGYGTFGLSCSRKTIMAHRYSWELHYGPLPKDTAKYVHGTCVLHKCDTPACVRPDHLFLGTQQENIADRHTKQRDARGSRAGGAPVLTEEQIREIRALPVRLGSKWSEGLDRKEVGARYGVSGDTIYRIVTRRAWNWC